MSIFSGLFDRSVALRQRPIGEAAALFPETARCVAGAVEKRRREFLTGRACAHEALAELGAPAEALLPGPDRVPLWPAGFTGCITHTDRDCAAAACRIRHDIRSVAIDLEPAEPLPPDLWDAICRPEERAWVEAQPSTEKGVLVRAIFSAKECAFKAQFPLTRRMLGFHEVAVELELAEERFAVTYPHGAAQCTARGRIRMADGLIACALTL